MPPAFIYFDLGNVLLNFSHRRAARQMAEVAGVSAEKVWQVVFEGGLEWRFELGEIDARQFYERFCEGTGTRPDYDALDQAGSAIFDYNLTMLPLVAHLERAGHRLGILSNTNESHWKYCASGRYATIPASFEITVLSYQVHAMKPDEKIYRIAAERAGLAPENIFYTDDRMENVEGALRAGFDAVHYTTTPALARELRRRGVESSF
jgi:putative hydrolase of the HAD superfamily